MSEVLLEYDHILSAPTGEEYRARACARPLSANLWEAWIEFLPLGDSEPLRSPRETTQPNRTDAEYWATGLSAIYLEGALRRVPKFAGEVRVIPSSESEPPIFDEPARPVRPVILSPEAPIDPFAAIGKGEELLRMKLVAMEPWQLMRVIEGYGLADPSIALDQMSRAELSELIISSVRQQQAASFR